MELCRLASRQGGREVGTNDNEAFLLFDVPAYGGVAPGRPLVKSGIHENVHEIN